jgi:hypothetical protein
MNVRVLSASVCALVLCSAIPAAAQSGTVGVTAASSGVGVQIQAGNRLALRPEFTFLHATTEPSSSTGLLVDTSTTNLGMAINVPVYMMKQDRFATYISPRFEANRTSGSTGSMDEPSSTTKAVAASFGGEYRASDRFMIFGELGLEYAWHDRKSDSLATTIKFRGTGTRTAVGIGIFF